MQNRLKQKCGRRKFLSLVLGIVVLLSMAHASSFAYAGDAANTNEQNLYAQPGQIVQVAAINVRNPNPNLNNEEYERRQRDNIARGKQPLATPDPTQGRTRVGYKPKPSEENNQQQGPSQAENQTNVIVPEQDEPEKDEGSAAVSVDVKLGIEAVDENQGDIGAIHFDLYKDNGDGAFDSSKDTRIDGKTSDRGVYDLFNITSSGTYFVVDHDVPSEYERSDGEIVVYVDKNGTVTSPGRDVQLQDDIWRTNIVYNYASSFDPVANAEAASTVGYVMVAVAIVALIGFAFFIKLKFFK